MLVAKFLTDVGLDYAVENFELAGITTVKSLASLEASCFGSLGVESPEDRRKLFFLVHRVKKAVRDSRERKKNVVEEEEDFHHEGKDENGHSPAGGGAFDFDGLEDDDGTDDVDDQDDDLLSLTSESEGTENRNGNNDPNDESAPLLERELDLAAAAAEAEEVQTSRGRATTGTAGTRISTSSSSRTANNNNHRSGISSAAGTSGATRRSAAPPNGVGGAIVRGPAAAATAKKKVGAGNNFGGGSRRLSGVPQPSTSGKRNSTAAAIAGGGRGGRGGSGANSNASSGIPNRRHSEGVGSMRTGGKSSYAPASRGRVPMSPLSETTAACGGGSKAALPAQSFDAGADGGGGNNLLPSSVAANVTSRRKNSSSSLRVGTAPGLDSDDDDDELLEGGSSKNNSISNRNGSGLRVTTRSRAREQNNNHNSSNNVAAAVAQRLSNLPATATTTNGRGGGGGRMSNLSRSSSVRSEPAGGPPSRGVGVGLGGAADPRRSPTSKSGKSAALTTTKSHSCSSSRASSRTPPSSPRQHHRAGGCGGSRNNHHHNHNNVVRHGVGMDAKDESFRAQIARLRQDSEDEHALFDGSFSPPCDEDGYVDCDFMRIRVVVRKRPLSKREGTAGDVDVIHPLDCGEYGRVLVYQPRTRVDLTKEVETVPFAFDNVFDESACNRKLYERCVRHLIPNLLEGNWGSIFAYGQTGSGKTFTMMGADSTTGGVNSSDNWGLYYLAALDIFNQIRGDFNHLSVSVSLFEIYGGKLYDLLNDRAAVKCLENHQGRVCFPGLSQHAVGDANELLEIIKDGTAQRSTGTTSRNADSSRSHAVLQLHLYENEGSGGRGDGDQEYSRLTFIDLAGSERGADTSSASRATRMEGAEINTSLLALKEVIRAMATGDAMTHVPFRGSRLTQVLKESFVGSNTAQSVMIACISPNIGNCEQTLNTLRYADRVKERNAETGRPSTAVSQQPPPQRQPRARASIATSTLAPPRNQHQKSKDARKSLNPFSAITSAEEKEEEEEEELLVDDEDDGNCIHHKAASLDLSLASNASALLDDILATPKANAINNNTLSSPAKGRSSGRLSPAAKQLIAAHGEAANVMLELLHEEYALHSEVNERDGPHDGIDDYVARMEEILERQYKILSSLRRLISQYHGDSNGHDAGGDPKDLLQVEDDDDEDFEDLRD